MSTPTRDAMVALAVLARDLRKRIRSTDDVLDHVAAAAVALIPGADSACLVLMRGRTPEAVASTDPIALRLTEEQLQQGEGPLSAEIAHLDSMVATLAGDHRWSEFGERARRDGIVSLAAFRLITDIGDMGTLVVYGRSQTAFDGDAAMIGECLAAHAAIAVASARDETNFRSGLAHRDSIGQAKGMLMERYNVDADHAFKLLTSLSQNENQPLHAIARRLVDIDHPPSV